MYFQMALMEFHILETIQLYAFFNKSCQVQSNIIIPCLKFILNNNEKKKKKKKKDILLG